MARNAIRIAGIGCAGDDRRLFRLYLLRTLRGPFQVWLPAPGCMHDPASLRWAAGTPGPHPVHGAIGVLVGENQGLRSVWIQPWRSLGGIDPFQHAGDAMVDFSSVDGLVSGVVACHFLMEAPIPVFGNGAMQRLVSLVVCGFLVFCIVPTRLLGYKAERGLGGDCSWSSREGLRDEREKEQQKAAEVVHLDCVEGVWFNRDSAVSVRQIRAE